MIGAGIPDDELMLLTAEEMADAYERIGMGREYGRLVHSELHSGRDFIE